MKYNRIFILGTVGSGKSYLGRKLAEEIGAEHCDLDEIYWENKYNKKRKNSERDKTLETITKKNKWVIEGVYTAWTKEAMKKSDVLVLLDFPFRVLATRIIKRHLTDNHKGSVKDLRRMLRYARVYKKTRHSPCGFYAEKKIIDKYGLNHLTLTKKREIKEFLKEVK